MNPESFSARVSLLVIDKIVIGAIIAVAFVAYDSYRTEETRKYESARAKVQLEFEQAKLAREFLPLILDHNADVVTRGYVLRAAVRTGALDAEAAVELSRELLDDNISEEHFRRIMAATLPAALPAISNQAVALARRWREQHGGAFSPNAIYNPVSGVERIPEDKRAQIMEGRLWRDILFDALPLIESSQSLQETADINRSFYGLFILFGTSNSFGTDRLSQSSSRGLSLIGNLGRLLFRRADTDAAERVGVELLAGHSLLENIQLVRTILGVLLEYGSPSGAIALPIAQILVEDQPDTEFRTAHYWLRWRAGTVLVAMSEGAQPAEPILVDYLSSFAMNLEQASTDEDLRVLYRRYESGKLIRLMVDVTGSFDSTDSRRVLALVLSNGEKLRGFPFLTEDLERALGRPDDS